MNSIYPWQTDQWQQLSQRHQAGNLPHALLFAGVKDLGKRQLAENLAARILCSSDSPSCGSCHSCQWLAANNHPDLFYLQPADDSKVIKIEQVRELIDSLNQTAHGKQQVVIIDPAEALNRAAANALLKNLEEPNGAVFFLLISHQASALPATIRSRCQMLKFAIPSYTLAHDWLKQQLPPKENIQQENIQQILLLADNIPLRALDLVTSKALDEQQKIVQLFMDLFLASKSPLAVAQTYAESEPTLVIDVLWSIIRDLISIQLRANFPLKYSQWQENLTIISQRISTLLLFHFLDQLLSLRKWQEEKINLNLQLQWEEILINCTGTE